MIHICHANVRGALYRNLCRALLYSCKECYVPLQQLLVAFSRILWAQQTGHLKIFFVSKHLLTKKIFREEHLAEQRPSHGSLEARCCHLLGKHQELLRWQAVSCSPAVSQHPSNTGCGLKESLQSDGNCNRAPRDGPVYLASSA